MYLTHKVFIKKVQFSRVDTFIQFHLLIWYRFALHSYLLLKSYPLSFVLKALSTKHLYVVIKTRWKGLRNLNVYFIIADQSFFSFFSNLDPYQLQTTDTIAPWRDSIFLIPLKGEKDMKTRFRI